MRQFAFLGGVLFIALRCQSPAIKEAPNCAILHLDSIQAAEVIVEDTMEHFFDQISELDMAIQLKLEKGEGLPRKVLLEQYRSFLKTDVGHFSDEESQMLNDIFAKAFALCQKLSPDLLPDTLRLLKTKGRHYGPSVFYTRQQCIIIPENDLLEPDSEKLLQVMLHELFHIYSRYHPEQRTQLYQLIGFSPLSGTLHYPAALERTLLCNPDGINVAYAIHLPDANSPVQAIPLIRSRYEHFDPVLPDFFAYLSFDLYAIKAIADDTFEVQCRADGSGTLTDVEKAGFRKQIGDNTDYIIHPDEILADNFALLALKGAGKDQLLQKIKELIVK